MTRPQRVLAFDPSANNLGWATLNITAGRPAHIGSGCWHPSKAKGAAYRFDQLADFVAYTVAANEPEAVVVEVPSGGQRQNYKSLMTYAEAIGVVEAAAYGAYQGLVYRVPVNTWKRNASKAHTEMVVRAALRVDTAGKSDDEVDAIGIALWFIESGWRYADRLDGHLALAPSGGREE